MMHKMFCLLVFCAISLVACQDKSVPTLVTYEPGVPFELAAGTSAQCDCGTPDVSFVEVLSDSRCPTEVECFWAGEVTVLLSVDNESIRLSNSVEPDFNLHTDTLGNFSYRLLRVAPYPTGTTEIPAGDYTVELVVEAL